MKNSDLHTHSYYSDGMFSPREVVKLAKKNGIKTLSLTDHNSFDGVEEAITMGKKLGIRIIPGIELRSKDGEVLGYFIDIHNKELISNVKKIQKRSEEVFNNTLKKLKGVGIKAKSEEVLDTKFKRQNVIIAYLWKYLKRKYDLDIKEIKKLMKGPKFKAKFSTEKVIKIIINGGGVPVLAHPWYSQKLLSDKRFKLLVKAGLKGVEIDNGGINEEKKTQIKKIIGFAKKYNLIITSGSDFHGDFLLMSTKHSIGKSNCDEKVVSELNLARSKR